MSEDPLALYSIASTMPSSDPSVLPSESDYEAICAAVMETLRGRWFLAEYARRNRHSDTKVVLTAIERIEAMIRGDTVATPAERFRNELADMAKAIARTKSEIAAIKPEAEHPGKILEASEELDSIVHATEKATSNILAAAEQVQEIAWTVREQDLAAPICDQLDALATDIYTACSFQDLTGQRIQKVIHAMRYLEERIDTMIAIWDEGVSGQNASSTAKPEAAPSKAAAQPAHHDVALDDLDQTDVDMVMDPAQQEAAVKAEPATGRVTIDHAPLHAAANAMSETMAEPQSFASESVAQDAVAADDMAADDTTPESVAHHSAAEEPAVAHSFVSDENFTATAAAEAASADASMAEFAAIETAAIETSAIEAATAETNATAAVELIATESEAIAADDVTAESLAPETAEAEYLAAENVVTEAIAASGDAVVADELEEVPVFFRAMEPMPDVETPPAETASVGETADAVAEMAEPEIAELQSAKIEIAPVEIVPVQAIVALPEATTETVTADQTAPEATTGTEPDLGSTIAAVREALFAFPGLASPAVRGSDAATDASDEAASVGADEPAADLYEPEPAIATAAAETAVADSIATASDDAAPEGPTETLDGPADFLLEPLSPPALRALAAVTPFAEHDADAAEVAHAASEPVHLDVVELPVAKAIEAAAIDLATDEVAADETATDMPAIGEAVASPVEAARPDHIEPEVAAPTVTILKATDPGDIVETVDLDSVGIAPVKIAAEAPARPAASMTESETSDADATVDAPMAREAEVIAAISPESADIDIIEIAEIDAAATVPVAPEVVASEPVAEATAETEAEPEADAPAMTEELEAPVVAAETAPKAPEPEVTEEEREEIRPAARTIMPEVTFASTAPVMMPMETTRAEPAEERFAAAATAMPPSVSPVIMAPTAVVEPTPVAQAPATQATVTPAQAEFIPFGQVAAARPAVAARPVAVAAPSIYPTPADATPRPAAAHVTQSDPLAAITALTDDEKIALFS